MLNPHSPDEINYKQEINSKLNAYNRNKIRDNIGLQPLLDRNTEYTRGKLQNKNIDMSQRVLLANPVMNQTLLTHNDIQYKKNQFSSNRKIMDSSKLNSRNYDLPFNRELIPKTTSYPVHKIDHNLNFNNDKYQRLQRLEIKPQSLPSFINHGRIERNDYGKEKRINNEKLFEYNLKRLPQNRKIKIFDNKPIDSRKFSNEKNIPQQSYNQILQNTFNLDSGRSR